MLQSCVRRCLSTTPRSASANVYTGANKDLDILSRGNMPPRRLFKPYQSINLSTCTDIASYQYPCSKLLVIETCQTYDPKDLNQKDASFYQAAKLKEPKVDIFAVLNLNPMDMYKNTRLLSDFVTEIGHIKPRTETGLSIVNQKRLSKAIKRAQSMGLMPYTYKLYFANQF
ncbi:hypothetical protein CcCBS67573_g06176 [Chytriomyces confervae]|uniref:Small ribosomal subunit protein bS18m n=1 Tax=Chytriomyces confervae TaxID=246404 RepID=A0A507F5N8_9FUNG|nr:hypothetical protein CcCBS67573_g06176 [Chytriomyces confervae]